MRFEAVDTGAVAEYGGADIAVYRVPRPLEFLQKQKNLHRVRVEGNYAGEGLANALRHAWDAWYVRSRETWRALFSPAARGEAIKEAPELKTAAGFAAPTRYRQDPQYQPIKGLDLVGHFRYPVAAAKPIAPPADVALAGSSSEFIQPQGGNVLIPIGRQKPGLYLVEAAVGQHRAVTLVFVADTVAITKTSAAQMLVWAAGRRDGRPAAAARVLWTDGTGVLKSGSTDARGLVAFERSAPEQTYVMGEDAAGGVFISENFYYDSEIYNAKLYAVTDRPLYRPGDQVFIKVFGRDFISARESRPVAAGELQLEVFDPNGLPVTRQKIALTPEAGADTSFRLPDNAPAGGYDIRFTYKNDRYGAAFRVAEYQKPHFEIGVLTDKPDYRTNEAISGRVQLVYPDGKPVRRAAVELSVRAQQMTMVEGDLGYGGQFPVKLAGASLTTDEKGYAAFSLPAATVPSRYVLTVFATDGAAYRVKHTRELLVERGSQAYALRAAQQFSSAGENVRFDFAPVGEPGSPPARWEWVRLENRKRQEGPLSETGPLTLAFPEPGSYTVTLRDARGNVVAAASHFVGGEGVKAPAGSIGIVFDRVQYRPGDTAQALITFPVAVDSALLTLERDRVEQSALLQGGADWVGVERLTPTQWRARLKVREDHAPNITFSVAYVKDGDYVFQNQGFRVEQPRIQVEFRTEKPSYRPGETVNVEVVARAAGKPVAALLAVGVVDEMIYVLQPEIAPDIFEFFYHPRRNNVRTSASLNFIGYDLAQPRAGKAPARRQVNERAVKVLERPRREEIDTAYWNARLQTGADGRARFSFVMPDSLTRWRLTARGLDAAGTAGQAVAWLRSEKPVFAKWTSPDWLREQDAPQASVALFNQTSADLAVELVASGAVEKREKLVLKPGANFMPLALDAGAAGKPLQLTVLQDGKPVDRLETRLRREPLDWSSRHTLAVEVRDRQTPIRLPADATRLRLRFAASADAQLARIADDLIDYPYGCVEQTASRLIPLTLAAQSLGDSEGPAGLLRQRLYSQRFRLAQMAGPHAVFGWWGDLTGEDPFLTAYAYYADWLAGRTLGLVLPQEHWDRLLDVYAKKGYRLPPLQRALALHWMQEMGLPVGSLLDALAEDLARATAPGGARPVSAQASLVLTEPGGARALAAARVLTAYGAQRAQAQGGRALAAGLAADVDVLRQGGQPFELALLMLAGKLPAARAEEVLGQVRSDMPTFERAMTLVWTHRALGGRPGRAETAAMPAAPWQAVTSASGRKTFVLAPQAPLPASLELAAAPKGATTAFIDYESRAPEAGTLPVGVERRLYRLVRGETRRAKEAEAAPRRGQAAAAPENVSLTAEFGLEAVGRGEALHADEVYLDEIVLRPAAGQTLRYGLLEAALPPGAAVERTTWGIALRRAGKAEAMERSRAEDTRYGYAVAVEPLAGETVIRHLVRFSQKGRYALPPARFHRMYQPEQKAFERKEQAWTALRVE